MLFSVYALALDTNPLVSSVFTRFGAHAPPKFTRNTFAIYSGLTLRYARTKPVRYTTGKIHAPCKPRCSSNDKTTLSLSLSLSLSLPLS